MDDDDKYVVVGAAGEGLDDEGVIIQPDFALARYNEDGSLDTDFDGDGLVYTDFSGVNASFDEAGALAITDDEIIVAGFSQACGETTAGNTCGEIPVDMTADGAGEEPLTEEDFALARYDYDGLLDTTFGSGGLVITDFDGQFDVVEAIALVEDDDEDGYKLVAAGITVIGEGDTEEDFALARYHSNGRLDKGFGDGGLVVTDFFGLPDQATGVAVINNKIVLAGKAERFAEEEDFALARDSLLIAPG